MITPYLIGMFGVAALAAGWVAVQLAWGRSFPDPAADPDVLARRPGCGDCARRHPCNSTLSSEENRK